MKKFEKIDLEKIKEAIKQADANIKFEEIESQSKENNKNQTVKAFKRGNNYGR